MKKYIFKTHHEQKSFYAKNVFEAKKMAFNYFKTNLIDLVC